MLYIVVIIISFVVGFLIGFLVAKYSGCSFLGAIGKKTSSDKITSGKVATKASEILRGGASFNQKAKSVAGSALSQSRHHNNKKHSKHKK